MQRVPVPARRAVRRVGGVGVRQAPEVRGDVPEQIENGAFGLFDCHATPDFLCAGWVACHDMRNNLAMRLTRGEVDDQVYDYESPVPLFSSGMEAAELGKREIKNPSERAKAKGRQIRMVRERRGFPLT